MPSATGFERKISRHTIRLQKCFICCLLGRRHFLHLLSIVVGIEFNSCRCYQTKNNKKYKQN